MARSYSSVKASSKWKKGRKSSKPKSKTGVKKWKSQSFTGGALPRNGAVGKNLSKLNVSGYQVVYDIINGTTDATVNLYNPSGGANLAIGSQGNDILGQQFGGAFTFTGGGMTGASDKMAIFDQYKIKAVEVMLAYNTDSPGGNNSSQSWQYPTVYYCVDTDDAIVPSNLATLLGRGDTKVAQLVPGKPLKVLVTPKTSVPVYDAAGVLSTSYALGTNQWIDCVNPTAAYYGLKFWVRNFPAFATTAQHGVTQISVIVKYHMEFQGILV